MRLIWGAAGSDVCHRCQCNLIAVPCDARGFMMLVALLMLLSLWLLTRTRIVW
jgi:hypothetical protein